MNFRNLTGNQRRKLLERSLEILAILITVILGFLSHKNALISLEFLLTFIAFSISWLLISFLSSPNFKNLFLLSIFSVSFGALIRAILLMKGSIPVSFVIVFWIFQTIMLYIVRSILVFIK